MKLKTLNNLEYEEYGNENNKIILFLHPKLLSNWIWKYQKEDFNEFHCIYLNLPHHEKDKRKREEEGFSIEKSSKSIIEFIKEVLNQKQKPQSKLNVIAMGLGGSIALEILNKSPDLIDNLIISSPECCQESDTDNDPLERLAKTKAEYLNTKPDQFIVKAYLRYFGISKEFYNDMEEILDFSIKKEREIAFESLNYHIDHLKKNEMIKNKNNILIAYGTKENLNSRKSAIELKTVFKNANLIEINKGTELWNINNPKLFNSITKEFIKKGKVSEDKDIRIIK